MKGLWHIDRLQFEVALQYLTYPSLIPTFPDEILETLVQHAKHDDMTLPLAYYHTVQPTLTSSNATESLFTAIARASITEAFYFSRGQAENAQKHMFELLIFVEEESWFEDYLTTGDGRTLRKAKDTLLMRKIGTGRFTEAVLVEGTSSRAVGGLSWDMMQNAVQNGLGKRLEVQTYEYP